MTKNKTLMMLLGLCLFFNVDLAMADTIELKDNRVYKVDCYWEKDGKIFYQKHGTAVSFEKSQIKKIIDESGPVPKIVYGNESAENKNGLIQSNKKEYTVKSDEQIMRELVKENRYSFPPKYDFEYKGTHYKYVRPGFYHADNGTFYRTTQDAMVDGKPFPPKHDFEYNGTRYKYISPGVYKAENGTIDKTNGISSGK